MVPAHGEPARPDARATSEQLSRSDSEPAVNGPAPHILLLPGLLCDERLFAPQLRMLRRLYPEAQIYAPPALPEGNSMEQIGRSLIAEADAQFAASTPAPGELILIGLSMGGIAAMEILRQCPERVAAMSLLDSNALPEGPEQSQKRFALVDEAAEKGIGTAYEEKLLPSLLSGPSSAGYSSGATLPRLMVSMAERVGLSRFRAHAGALASRPDYSSVLAGFRGPAQIIAGADDLLTPSDRQHHLQYCLPQATLHFVGSCGHISTLEKPQEVTRLLSSWLRIVLCDS